jgi:hypothetical protein
MRRLQGNLEIARGDLKVPAQRPRDGLTAVIKEKLTEAYNEIFASRRLALPDKEAGRKTRFLKIVAPMVNTRFLGGVSQK